MQTNVLFFIIQEFAFSFVWSLFLVIPSQLIMYMFGILGSVDWSITLPACLVLSGLHTSWKLFHVKLDLEFDE